MGAMFGCSKGNTSTSLENSNEKWEITDITIKHDSDGNRIKAARSGRPVRSKKGMFDIKDFDICTPGRYFNKQTDSVNGMSPFTDSYYPADQNSISFIPEGNAQKNVLMDYEIEDLNNFTWKRCSDIVSDGNSLLKDDYKLYGTISDKDIRQGTIGNCYFLCSVAALAEFPKRYDPIFINNKRTISGGYQLRLMIDGVPKIITVDDHFLWDNNQNNFAGANSGDGEIWVQLMEKVWAKACKSYAMTIAGTPANALSALTSAPVMSYIHAKYTRDSESLSRLWQILLEADKANYIICTNTGNLDEKELEAAGLVLGHAYTILACYNVDNVRLLKLRNPWGEFEWKGDFSDHSPEWDKSPALKEIHNQQGKEDDGIFFMKFSDYLYYYPYTFISEYRDNAIYDYVRVYQLSQDVMTALKINIAVETDITISMHQRSDRLYHKVDNYQTPMARLIVAKYTPGKAKAYEFIGSDSGADDKLHVSERLQPGEYHIFANNSWNYSQKNKYVISTYASPVHKTESDIETHIQKLPSSYIPDDYLIQILSDYCNKKCKTNTLTTNSTYENSVEDNDTGFFMLKFNNNSDNEYLCVNFSYQADDSCQLFSKALSKDLVSEDLGNGLRSDKIVITMEPGKSNMIVMKLEKQVWKCKFDIGNISCTTKHVKEATQDKITNHNNPYETTIKDSLKSIERNPLTDFCSYGEIDVQDGILVVFFNDSKTEAYKMGVNFVDMVNCRPSDSKSNFTVRPECYDYVKLSKFDEYQDMGFGLSFSCRKVR